MTLCGLSWATRYIIHKFLEARGENIEPFGISFTSWLLEPTSTFVDVGGHDQLANALVWQKDTNYLLIAAKPLTEATSRKRSFGTSFTILSAALAEPGDSPQTTSPFGISFTRYRTALPEMSSPGSVGPDDTRQMLSDSHAG